MKSIPSVNTIPLLATRQMSYGSQISEKEKLQESLENKQQGLLEGLSASIISCIAACFSRSEIKKSNENNGYQSFEEKKLGASEDEKKSLADRPLGSAQNFIDFYTNGSLQSQIQRQSNAKELPARIPDEIKQEMQECRGLVSSILESPLEGDALRARLIGALENFQHIWIDMGIFVAENRYEAMLEALIIKALEAKDNIEKKDIESLAIEAPLLTYILTPERRNYLIYLLKLILDNDKLKLIPNFPLTYLNLDNNDLENISKALCKSKRDILRLDLSINFLDDETPKIVGKKFLLTDAKIHELLINGHSFFGQPHKFGDQGARSLAEALPQAKELKKLSIAKNAVTLEGVRALIKVLGSTSIEELDLSGNSLTPEQKEELAKESFYNKNSGKPGEPRKPIKLIL